MGNCAVAGGDLWLFLVSRSGLYAKTSVDDVRTCGKRTIRLLDVLLRNYELAIPGLFERFTLDGGYTGLSSGLS